MERSFHPGSRLQGMAAVLALLMPVTFGVLLATERLFPARVLPRVRGWLLKGVVFFVVGGVIGAVLPALVAAAVGERAPVDLRGLGTLGGAAVGFLAADLALYGVHRLIHNVPLLWRWTHQLHHSAERLDVAGSSYFHPFDIALLGGVAALVPALLGITPDAAALAGFVGFFLQTFQHANVTTPQWLGWIIQRPEAHAVHHARDVHAYNYGNFMLWDIALGTFRNPATFGEAAGFWDGASAELGPMLIGRDVSHPGTDRFHQEGTKRC
jgi:sterol desaturase/sphingolipid hydroxylase (fatty acid hydroxylase superfamily)